MLSTMNHFGMAAHLLALALLYLLASPAIRVATRVWIKKQRASTPPNPPKLALIVPLTGNNPNIERCLLSLLHQTGIVCPAYFAVRDKNDPGVDLVEMLMQDNPQVRLIVAGPTRTCCQKNHNLLAAIDAANAESIDNALGILVFCDSTHEAAPDFLVRLIAPIIEGRAVLSTTYHRVVPINGSLPTLCHFFSALGIQLLQNLPIFCQPWGGATAILNSVFFRHGVDAVWARGIVDDFTMGPYLQSRGVRAMVVPEASLVTTLDEQSLGGWLSWWFRQLLYLKFCMPLTWVAATLGVLGVTEIMAWALWGAVTGSIISWLYFAALGCMGIVFGTLSQTRQPLWRLAVSFLTMQALSLLCFLATWGTNTLHWRDISYRARLDGTVKEIIPKSQGCIGPKQH